MKFHINLTSITKRSNYRISESHGLGFWDFGDPQIMLQLPYTSRTTQNATSRVAEWLFQLPSSTSDLGPTPDPLHSAFLHPSPCSN
jgi:hypothetical protein